MEGEGFSQSRARGGVDVRGLPELYEEQSVLGSKQ